MKINLRKSFDTAIDWLFFNNNNIVDATRGHITDATPLHTTGLNRFFYEPRNLVALTIALVALTTNLDTKTATELVCGTIAGLSVHEIAYKKGIQGLFNGKCINKKPKAEHHTDIQDLEHLSYEKFKRKWLIPVLALWIGSTLKDTITTEHVAFGVSTWITALAGIAQDYRIFKKISDRKWIIEDSHQPEKEEAYAAPPTFV